MNSSESRAANLSDNTPRRWDVQAVLSLIGFTAVVAQIVLMRELMVVFHGNEMSLGWMLASWLLWTAIGSSALGRLARQSSQPHKLLAVLQTLAAIAFPSAIFLVRISGELLRPVPGEVLGPGPMLLTSFVVLSAFCVISGGSFSAGSQLCARMAGASTVEGTSRMYLLEAVGSGVGGFLASLLLIRYCPPFTIAFLLSLLNLAGAATLAIQSKRQRVLAMGTVACAFLLIALPFGAPWLERISLARLWRGYNLVATSNSIYGNLAVVQTGGIRSLFENGVVAFHVPDLLSAEEAVHFALLQHPAPKSLLLVGGGANGSLVQALQYTSLERIDYVELDPVVLDVSAEYFPEEWVPAIADPRVHVDDVDGRLFLKTAETKFDVVILDLPDPQTAQLNRFYTREFFEAVARKLTPTGVFSFQLTGAEDYISPERADFLRCIQRTLRSVFPETLVIPGDTIHFLAAAQPGDLTIDPAVLVARLRARQIHTSYLREYYLPYRMMPDRLNDLQSLMQARTDTRVNSDFAPVAYYYNVVLWSTQFGGAYRRTFQAIGQLPFSRLATWVGIVVFAIALLAILLPMTNRPQVAAGLSVAAMGFTLMALEILLLLAFQAVYGYVYQQLAVIIAGFMVGIALGSWLGSWRAIRAEPHSLDRNEVLRLVALQVAAASAPIVLYLAFERLAAANAPASTFLLSEVLFPLLAVLCGVLGGYQFPIGSRVFFANLEERLRSPGTLYALDLAGACLGALCLSSYLVPMLGFERTAWLIAIVNLAPAAALLRLAWGKAAAQE